METVFIKKWSLGSEVHGSYLIKYLFFCWKFFFCSGSRKNVENPLSTFQICSLKNNLVIYLNQWQFIPTLSDMCFVHIFKFFP